MVLCCIASYCALDCCFYAWVMFRLLWILLICLFSVMLCVYVDGGWVVWFGLALFSLLVIWCWFMLLIVVCVGLLIYFSVVC